MEIVKSAVPPAGKVLGEKLLETSGLDWLTGSLSWTEQTPLAVQDTLGLVFVTLGGGAIAAMLVT